MARMFIFIHHLFLWSSSSSLQIGERGKLRDASEVTKKNSKSDPVPLCLRESPSTGLQHIMSGKYPKTPHLPFSPEVNYEDEDVVMDTKLCSTLFTKKEVVITEKLDGGNCQLYGGKVFARTTKAEASHASFSAVKQLYETFKWQHPEALALFGENMQGVHSIEYDRLDSYFYLFAVYNTKHQKWLSWDQVMQVASHFNIPTVPLLFRGTFDSLGDIEKWMNREIKEKKSKKSSTVGPEGFVIRDTGAFHDSEFDKHVAKYVRKGHIQTKSDWTRTWRQAKIFTTNPNEVVNKDNNNNTTTDTDSNNSNNTNGTQADTSTSSTTKG